MLIITQLLCIDIHYFILLQNHNYMPSTCYFLVTIVLLRHYCFIITQLQICMSITSNYYKIITTSLRSLIAMVLHITTWLPQSDFSLPWHWWLPLFQALTKHWRAGCRVDTSTGPAFRIPVDIFANELELQWPAC